MRFKQYLNEASPPKEEILALIKKDCKPFLADWRKLKTDDFLLSGRNDKTFFTKKQVRKDRKPLDTLLDMHKIIDDWFYKKFGVKSRSNAVFCSFDIIITSGYGTPYLVFPIGKYKAVSSKNIKDLFRVAIINDEEKIIEILERGKYTDKLTYYENEGEIMVTCKDYYMVNFSLVDYLLENLRG